MEEPNPPAKKIQWWIPALIGFAVIMVGVGWWIKKKREFFKVDAKFNPSPFSFAQLDRLARVLMFLSPLTFPKIKEIGFDPKSKWAVLIVKDEKGNLHRFELEKYALAFMKLTRDSSWTNAIAQSDLFHVFPPVVESEAWWNYVLEDVHQRFYAMGYLDPPPSFMPFSETRFLNDQIATFWVSDRFGSHQQWTWLRMIAQNALAVKRKGNLLLALDMAQPIPLYMDKYAFPMIGNAPQGVDILNCSGIPPGTDSLPFSLYAAEKRIGESVVVTRLFLDPLTTIPIAEYQKVLYSGKSGWLQWDALAGPVLVKALNQSDACYQERPAVSVLPPQCNVHGTDYKTDLSDFYDQIAAMYELTDPNALPLGVNLPPMDKLNYSSRGRGVAVLNTKYVPEHGETPEKGGNVYAEIATIQTPVSVHYVLGPDMCTLTTPLTFQTVQDLQTAMKRQVLEQRYSSPEGPSIYEAGEACGAILPNGTSKVALNSFQISSEPQTCVLSKEGFPEWQPSVKDEGMATPCTLGTIGTKNGRTYFCIDHAWVEPVDKSSLALKKSVGNYPHADTLLEKRKKEMAQHKNGFDVPMKPMTLPENYGKRKDEPLALAKEPLALAKEAFPAHIWLTVSDQLLTKLSENARNEHVWMELFVKRLIPSLAAEKFKQELNQKYRPRVYAIHNGAFVVDKNKALKLCQLAAEFNTEFKLEFPYSVDGITENTMMNTPCLTNAQGELLFWPYDPHPWRQVAQRASSKTRKATNEEWAYALFDQAVYGRTDPFWIKEWPAKKISAQRVPASAIKAVESDLARTSFTELALETADQVCTLACSNFKHANVEAQGMCDCSTGLAEWPYPVQFLAESPAGTSVISHELLMPLKWDQGIASPLDKLIVGEETPDPMFSRCRVLDDLKEDGWVCGGGVKDPYKSNGLCLSGPCWFYDPERYYSLKAMYGK
jgi:hypothetical protein